jgi:hypothetical protein
MSVDTITSDKLDVELNKNERIKTLAQLYKKLSEQRVKLLYMEQRRAKKKYKMLSNEITSLIEEMMVSVKANENVKEEAEAEQIVA